MKILKTVRRVPGGMMVIPLIIGAILNTYFIKYIDIGSFTSAVYTKEGTGPILGLAIFFIGTQLRIREAGTVLKRGFVMLLVKFAAGVAIGLLINAIFGPTGFLGISVLAIIASLTNSNGGLYMALTSEYGEPNDVGAQAVLNLNDGPFLTLLALGASGIATIPFISLIAALGPMIVGVVLGNLDEDIRDFFAPGVAISIPCFAFSLGATIDVNSMFAAGASGIILGLMVVVFTGVPLILADRFILKRPGYAGAALASCAGNAVGTPLAIAEATKGAPGGEVWASIAQAATAQVATAVVLTAILVPILTSFIAKKYGSVKNGMVQANGKPALGATTK